MPIAMAAAPKRARDTPTGVQEPGMDTGEVTGDQCSGVVVVHTYTNSRWPKHKATIYLLVDNNATDPALLGFVVGEA